ncbi:MAG TPA: T9SS type A sorting domain-containing protein, partial [Chitinophagaceae bacterium]|nr:T9SS type A sorting domain-containing protein [Chitinophagaceae bacterium]
MRHFYFTLLLAIVGMTVHAQFTTVGSASPSSPGVPNATCFQLTPSLLNQAGAVWNNTPIDLSQNFTLTTKLYFGDVDAGADGLAFVLRSTFTPTLGTGGGGLGYSGIYSSFIVEFDTWQNNVGCFSTGDPAGDHLGFMAGGSPFHVQGPPPCNSPAGALQPPVEFNSNIEDGQWHDATFSWDAGTHTFTVLIFGQTYSFTGDIVNTVLGGNTTAIWGFTAGTGAGSGIANEHGVCITTTPPPPADCGQLRTQTPGGWGAEPHGNNPGTYLHNNFTAAFPNGLRVGCDGNYHIDLTNAQAITDLLPTGGKAAVLTKNETNPAAVKNVLVGHLVALTLSTGFDVYDDNFGQAGITLGQMEIGSGTFAGWTVNEFLAEANKVLGGCSTSYTVTEVLETATAINENYVDGSQDGGFLDCPTNQTGRITARRVSLSETVASFRVQPNPTRGQFEFQLANKETGLAQVQITNSNGIMVQSRSLSLAGRGQTLRFDLSRQAAGIYIVRVITSEGVQTQKIV